MPRTSLGVQWLRLHAFNAGDRGSIPGEEEKFHMSQSGAKIKKIKIFLLIKKKNNLFWVNETGV